MGLQEKGATPRGLGLLEYLYDVNVLGALSKSNLPSVGKYDLVLRGSMY